MVNNSEIQDFEWTFFVQEYVPYFGNKFQTFGQKYNYNLAPGLMLVFREETHRTTVKFIAKLLLK